MNDLTKMIKDELHSHGADLVGFGNLTELPEDVRCGLPIGICVAVKYPKKVIDGIASFPTIEYYNQYNILNKKLDILVTMGADYEEEKAFLQKVFCDTVLRISHIGSTAVPDLIAKPTIDILLEIKEDIDIAKITGMIVDKGYVVNTPPMDIITYLKGYGRDGFVEQAFHIHVRHSGDWNELYFRDYLIANPEAAKQYGTLKLGLKNEYEFDRDGYTAAKGEYIEKITALARTEFKDKYKPVAD